MNKVERCVGAALRVIVFAGFAFLMLSIAPAAAQSNASFFVDPFGSGTQCTPANRCALQTAMSSCYAQSVEICNIVLNDGVYADPGVNIYYYRVVRLTGNCLAPR